jgi:sortase B
LTNSALYTYEIFSAYYIRPENYYLQTNISDEYYLEFINTIKERSIIEFNVEVGINDKIITLSTCTDDNTGRKVIHAKLISEESY